MESGDLQDLIAVMPFDRVSSSDWDWFGASLARVIAEKLIVGGFAVLPCYDLGLTEKPLDTKQLTTWEEIIKLRGFLADGAMIAGSYLLEEKRIVIKTYAVRETGFSLLARDEDVLDNLMSLVDRVCYRILAGLGEPPNAETRERLTTATSTHNAEAYQAMVAAWEAWAAGDLNAVREAAGRAQALDGDFHEPLDILTQATRQLGTAQQLRAAQKTQLVHLMTLPAYFKGLVSIESLLAQARHVGDRELEADCLKAREAVERNSHALAKLYYARVQEIERRLVQLLEENEQHRLRILRSRGWGIGQVVTAFLIARSWLRRAEVNLEAGYYAYARLYADRAGKIYTTLGIAKKRQAAKALSDEAEAGLRGRAG